MSADMSLVLMLQLARRKKTAEERELAEQRRVADQEAWERHKRDTADKRAARKALRKGKRK
jgi:hypothetical protein